MTLAGPSGHPPSSVDRPDRQLDGILDSLTVRPCPPVFVRPDGWNFRKFAGTAGLSVGTVRLAVRFEAESAVRSKDLFGDAPALNCPADEGSQGQLSDLGRVMTHRGHCALGLPFVQAKTDDLCRRSHN